MVGWLVCMREAVKGLAEPIDIDDGV